MSAVFALDASRLARNNRDWHHLIDLCAEECDVFIRDHHEGYISGEDFTEIQARIHDNAAMQGRMGKSGSGAARSGKGLLSGLLRCGGCGRSLNTKYGGDGSNPRYECPVHLKKRILRTVVREIIVSEHEDPSCILMSVHWFGGEHTHLEANRRTQGQHDNGNSRELVTLVKELASVCNDAGIVAILNRLGYRTGAGNTWTESRVQHLRHTNFRLVRSSSTPLGSSNVKT